MSTREQVQDLQPGDVVELSHSTWRGGKVCGPVVADDDGVLRCGPMIIRHSSGDAPIMPMNLTVVSRAPRPLYVNHPRTEPVPGDVVRDADSDDARSWSYADPKHTGEFCWRNTGRNGWCRRDELPTRLRLLVDGETGQVVQ